MELDDVEVLTCKLSGPIRQLVKGAGDMKNGVTRRHGERKYVMSKRRLLCGKGVSERSIAAKMKNPHARAVIELAALENIQDVLTSLEK